MVCECYKSLSSLRYFCLWLACLIVVHFDGNGRNFYFVASSVLGVNELSVSSLDFPLFLSVVICVCACVMI